MALIHFTSSKRALFSILRYGFLYLHNETGLLSALLEDRILPEIDVPTGGMVCFTDYELDNTKKIRKRFGNYGIAIKKDWALNRGATKVIYVDPKGPVFKSLKLILQENFPQEFNNEEHFPKARSGIEGLAQSIVLSNPFFLRDTQQRATYVELMKLICWMQTIEDYAQSEWRIRSPYAATVINREKKPKEEFIASIIDVIGSVALGRGEDFARETERIWSTFENQNKTFDEFMDYMNNHTRLLLSSLSCLLSKETIEFICVPKREFWEINSQIQRYRNVLDMPYRGVHVVGIESLEPPDKSTHE